MGAATALRDDFDGPGLRRLAKAAKDAGQSRRLLALAEIYDGGARSDAARMSGVGLQVIRDWVLRFNAAGPNGLIDRKASGPSPKLNDAQRRALAQIIESGPIPAMHGVVRWRLKDLAEWIWEEFRITLDETTVGREVKALGFAKISARPRHHAQSALVIEDFKKNLPTALEAIRAALPANTAIELWWQDEARIGQKNKITRRWAPRGTRPRAPKDRSLRR